MNDKLQRVKTLLMTGRKSVQDEPLEDLILMFQTMVFAQQSLVVESGENNEDKNTLPHGAWPL